MSVQFGMDIFNDFLRSFKIVRHLIRNFDTEFLLDSHENFYDIQRIQAEFRSEIWWGSECGSGAGYFIESLEDIEDAVVDLILV